MDMFNFKFKSILRIPKVLEDSGWNGIKSENIKIRKLWVNALA